MVSQKLARVWHLGTAALVGLALVAQLVLAIQGATVLIPDYAPSLPVRIWQFFSYFTIQSNIAVCVAALLIARSSTLGTQGRRVWRTCALLGISVTGLVYAVLLAPIANPVGLNWWLDRVLHLISPLVTLVGWLVFSPRRQLTTRALLWSLLWPVLWLAYTLVVGAIRGWYPYPFLDPRRAGGGSVAVACLGITVLFLVLGSALVWLDRKLPELRRR